MKIMHIREVEQQLVTARNPRGISNRGGATICYENQDGLGLKVSLARCHPTDNFNKRLGRAKAMGKFQGGRTHEIACFDVESLKECIHRWYLENYRRDLRLLRINR